MSPGDVDHGGNRRARVEQSDVRTQREQAEDRPSLLVGRQFLERSGQTTTGAGHGGTACPVVPVDGRVQGEIGSGVSEPYQELLDQETVIEDDNAFRRQRSGLLIREIGIVDRRQAELVAIPEHSSQLLARHDRASLY